MQRVRNGGSSFRLGTQRTLDLRVTSGFRTSFSTQNDSTMKAAHSCSQMVAVSQAPCPELNPNSPISSWNPFPTPLATRHVSNPSPSQSLSPPPAHRTGRAPCGVVVALVLLGTEVQHSVEGVSLLVHLVTKGVPADGSRDDGLGFGEGETKELGHGTCFHFKRYIYIYNIH